ncbi:SAV_915 family protein [Streptomyces sp. NPDC012794]|uniref:SAV_915 family protein n=1 Tax=Streptomyces sp. NPDC012794 TaxID=3364850 RepID=UPI0036C7147F
MCVYSYEDDPEPEERVPAGPLYVPVRPGGAEVVVRLFRTPLGARTAVGFTGPDRLAAVLGAGHPWIRLSEAALRALAEPLGVTPLTVDPVLTAPGVTPAPSAAPAAAPAAAAAVPAPPAPASSPAPSVPAPRASGSAARTA